MSSSSNNFSGATFDYLVPENNDLGLTGYPFEVTNGGPSTRETSGSYFDTSLAGLSTQEIVEWWLGPKSDCRADQYAGSTLLDCSRDEFAGPYDSQIGDAPGSNGFNSGESYHTPSCVVNTGLDANTSPRLWLRLRRVRATVHGRV